MELIYLMKRIIDDLETGALARRERIDSGKKLVQVAAKMGCSASLLCDLEKGKRGWSEKWVRKFNKAVK